MSIKRITVKILTILVILAICPSVWAATYYVSTSNGNDTNSGTLNSPWKSISKANGTLKQGDTAFIRAGDYFESIRPSNNGSAGNYITYASYNNEVVTIKRVTAAINLTNKNYINVDGINVDGEEIGDNAKVRQWVELEGGSYNIIQNGDFKKAYGWSGIHLKSGANHNKIINNTMKWCGSYPRDNGDMIFIVGADNNLIQNNTLSYGGHNLILLDGKNNVIKDNNLTNPWERLMEIRKYQGDGQRNLIEGNVLSGASPATDNPIPPGVKLLGANQIVRNNTVYNNVAYGFQISPKTLHPEAHDHRIYNNVFYNNGSEGVKLWNNVAEVNTSSSVFKNNIFYKNGSSQEINLKPETDGFNNNKIISNNIFRSSAGQALLSTRSYGLKNINWYETNHPNYVAKNLELEPEFVNEENGNFELQATSPMIDAGDYLTTIKSNSGSGTSFVVNDSGYFMDGWDIVEGDEIQLEGHTQTVKIINVDYSSNTITVNRNISWGNGDGVSLPYSGTAPDLGAFEYGQSESSISSPQNLRIIETN